MRLSEIGVRDSKLLSDKRRRALYDDIISIADEVKISAISAEEINQAMAAHISVNELEAKHFSSLFDQIGSFAHAIYLDSPDVIPERFGQRFSMNCKKPTRVRGIKSNLDIKSNYTRVIAEHKADARYPVVSAASIMAKVTRDNAIRQIEKKLRTKIGSGYPSDAYTIGVIRKHLGNERFEEHIRNRWATMDRIKQTSLDEF